VLTPAGTPPARPAGLASYADYRALDKYENYILDTAIPLQHINFNWAVELPVGRGKRFLGNSNRLVDELVGGFQLAGSGQVVSQDFQVGNGGWGQNNPIKVYKHNQPQITDCSSGVCHQEYLWYNGYISPKLISGNGGICTTNCISGLPADYVPYQTPINNDPTQPNFGTQNVQLSSPALLASHGGTPVTVAYQPNVFGQSGQNRYSHTFINGPMNYNLDLSMFKVFPITEKVNFRFNVDLFNALNIQGWTNPDGTSGIEKFQSGGAAGGGASSFWYNGGGRQMQLTARLTF
jgi:hypothetical protein